MSTEEPRRLELDALKALAHPLRVRLFSELTSFGPSTATTLGERLGESSGSTSYHLRQLERHGLVREDAERGTGRERWWERVPGPVTFASAEDDGRDAEDLVEMEFARLENARFADYWMQREAQGESWLRAAQSNELNLLLSPEELQEAGDRVMAVLEGYRDRPDDGTRRRVELTFRGYPVVRPTDGATG